MDHISPMSGRSPMTPPCDFASLLHSYNPLILHYEPKLKTAKLNMSPNVETRFLLLAGKHNKRNDEVVRWIGVRACITLRKFKD